MRSDWFSYKKAERTYAELVNATTPAEKAKRKWAESVMKGKELEATLAWDEYRDLMNHNDVAGPHSLY